MRIRDGKLLYHLTTLSVFESIVKNGLLSRGSLLQMELPFVDTANHDILEGRDRLGLVNYIPFHFHIHTNYDTYIKDHNRDKAFIYLCIHRDYAKANNFSILPIHPTSNEQPQIYSSYNEGIAHIDWDTMELKKTDIFPEGITERYRSQVRMAECLSPNIIPISAFQSIIVKDEASEKFVHNILDKYGIKENPPYINVKPKFF